MMRRFFNAIVDLLLAPGELGSDWLGVTQDQNRDLVRMLINSLFWIMIVVIGLVLWTDRLAIYR
jgi:hypothetical protein